MIVNQRYKKIQRMSLFVIVLNRWSLRLTSQQVCVYFQSSFMNSMSWEIIIICKYLHQLSSSSLPSCLAKFTMCSRSRLVVGQSRAKMRAVLAKTQERARRMTMEAKTFCPIEQRPFISIFLLPETAFSITIEQLQLFLRFESSSKVARISISPMSSPWQTSLHISARYLFTSSILSRWNLLIEFQRVLQKTSRSLAAASLVASYIFLKRYYFSMGLWYSWKAISALRSISLFLETQSTFNWLQDACFLLCSSSISSMLRSYRSIDLNYSTMDWTSPYRS